MLHPWIGTSNVLYILGNCWECMFWWFSVIGVEDDTPRVSGYERTESVIHAKKRRILSYLSHTNVSLQITSGSVGNYLTESSHNHIPQFRFIPRLLLNKLKDLKCPFITALSVNVVGVIIDGECDRYQ